MSQNKLSEVACVGSFVTVMRKTTVTHLLTVAAVGPLGVRTLFLRVHFDLGSLQSRMFSRLPLSFISAASDLTFLLLADC